MLYNGFIFPHYFHFTVFAAFNILDWHTKQSDHKHTTVTAHCETIYVHIQLKESGPRCYYAQRCPRGNGNQWNAGCALRKRDLLFPPRAKGSAAFHPQVPYMETDTVMNCQTLWKTSLLEQITWTNPKMPSWIAAFLKNKPNQNQTRTKNQQNQGLLIIQQQFSHLTPVSNLLYSSTVFTKHRLQTFTSNTKS